MARSEKRDDNGGRDTSTGRFTVGNKGGGRRAIPAAVREMLAAASPKAAKTLVDALEAERSIVVGGGDNAYIEQVPDVDMRVKAANAILDRVYGKPTAYVAGEDGGPAIVAVDLASMLQRLVR